MTTGGFVLDACALLALLLDEEGAAEVEKILLDAEDGDPTVVVHQINVLEIYYNILRRFGTTRADETLSAIAALPITFVDTLGEPVFREAGRIKANYRLSLADSIAVAEAKVRDARLVTSDHHELEPLEKAKEVSIFWFR
jgi:uncharacterized protein